MVNPNLGQPVQNKHKVPDKQWRKWTNHGRRVFNSMMYNMRPSMQFAYLHPDAQAAPKGHWSTTQWNAAWMAACAADGNGKLADATPLAGSPVRRQRAKRNGK